jgi:hypothetical protein
MTNVPHGSQILILLMASFTLTNDPIEMNKISSIRLYVAVPLLFAYMVPPC